MNPGICFHDLSYRSSFDGTAPLRLLAAYRPDGKRKPLMVCMHSYAGNRRQMQPCLAGRAAKGLFAIAPDMRGRAESGGTRDDGGLEIADIYDAVQAALAAFPNEIDPDNLNIVGWSGGGGSVFQAVTRMPDLFRTAQAFYGIADYGYLAGSSVDWARQVGASVGGLPAEVPIRYRLRNATEYAGNNRQTRFLIFWDEEETLCPPEMNLAYLQRAEALGLTNVTACQSRVGDEGRWIHGAEIRGDLAEALYEPGIVEGCFPRFTLPEEGTLHVPGFLITRYFTLCLGRGDRAVATLRYQLQRNRLRLTLSDRQQEEPVEAWLRVPILHRAGQGLPVRITQNGEPHPGPIVREEDPDHFYLYHLKDDVELTIEWQL